MPLNLLIHAAQFLIFLFALTSSIFPYFAQAEIWLDSDSYAESSQSLQLSYSDHFLDFRFLPSFSLIKNTSGTPFFDQARVGAQFDFQSVRKEQHNQVIIKELNLTKVISPYLDVSLGRLKIQYAQPDLFNRSLNKNDFSTFPVNTLPFSQGLLSRARFGAIEQSFFWNQKDENPDSQSSFHYQMKVGIPGYIIGPATLLISHEEQDFKKITRAMIGSALQFPLHLFHGDGQWAFQYAQELNNSIEDNQDAWQTSFSWLGFIPNHKIGILLSQTGRQWHYSDDFGPNTKHKELRYQWHIHQRLTAEIAAIRASAHVQSKENKDKLQMRFDFYF